MRVVQVSAHYPPDFVSGGTLVPARLSGGLRARGHDVRVFAGHVQSSEPLRVWDEVVDGVPVRWVGIRKFADWRLDEHFDHPAVATLFTDYLQEIRPEVVHLHSLQTLGGELVARGKAAGARVVVTMHDFWWICARQFLVDTTERPCGVAVVASACPCAETHAWLTDRNRFLAEQLAAADVILTPSRAAADVLIANGVDPCRLRVDENGLPPAPAPHAPHRPDGAVRFLFTGGPDPMKGWSVLQRAAARLTDLPDWTLTAYGVRDPDRSVLKKASAHVLARPPYRPADAPDVFGDHDVLVLPSLMRESYSIVTREALAAGLAVICTDTFGPEEAVRDEANGLVVPAGDDLSLAAAMRRVATEPGLLAELRSTSRSGVAFRALDDHVEGMEALYDELVAGTGAETAATDVRHVLFVAGIDGAPLRYRAHLAAEALGLLGVRTDVLHYRDPQVRTLARTTDAVVLYRVPATEQILELAAAIRDREPAVPLLFDIDDLIFDEAMRPYVHGLADLPADEVALWWQGVRRYRTTMAECDAYIGSTATLCEHAEKDVGLPAYRWANGAGVLLGQLSDLAERRPRSAGPLRIGYFSGTTMHDRDWAECEPAVTAVLRARPDVELWIGGHLTLGPDLAAFGRRVRRLPFLPWQELPERLRDVDVNLAPLSAGSPFNEAKSAIKWLEAALVGTPTVASPTQPFTEAIDDGATGLLAGTPEEWEEAIGRLLDDDALRRSVGERARREVQLRYGPHVQGRHYLQIITGATRLVRDPATARPVAPQDEKEFTDEPWAAIQFVPYQAEVVELHASGPLPRVPFVLRYALSARRVLREEGIAGAWAGVLRVAHKVVRRLRRIANDMPSRVAGRFR